MLRHSFAARALAPLLAGVSCFGLVAACSSASPSSGFDPNGGGGGDGGGGGGDGSIGNGDDGGTGNFKGQDSSATTGDASCAASSSKGEQLPLDLYIMLDRSSSMNDTVSGGGSKWSAVTAALKTYIAQPSLTGVSVGIQYFGVPASVGSCPPSCQTNADCGSSGPCVFNTCLGCAGGGDSCVAADYAKPDVEIAALPGGGTALTASINAHSPTTSTPTSAALQGAVDHAKAWATAHTGHAVVAVLATDGDPTECDTSIPNISAIAAAGVNGTPKILTFVIGVGSSLTSLNAIAAGGGTTKAFVVDTNANVNQQFLDALNQIRGTALGCNYKIPLPKSGTPDFSSVNVQFTPNGGTPQLIPQVADVGHCPASGMAWYYDNAGAPTQIILCASTCGSVTADSKGEVDVLTGCKTVVK
jgi:hypothetical protein